jgi:DNA-binding response OmpR family regulator
MYSEPNIIIISDDDTDDSLFLLEALLSLPLELTVINVPNGERLITVLESVSPHFIFLDINMPKKNGFDALKLIRSNKKLTQPTVIMCSTSRSHNEIKRSQELGADMYFTKPNNIKHMNKMIEDIFKTDWNVKDKKRTPEEFLVSSNKECA